MKTCRILVLSDNRTERADLLAEHGWSCWIEYGDRRILFDTGQGNVLLHNAFRLDVDLSETTDIVLSHGHYDHVNGLAVALRGKTPVRLWAHSAALEPKYRATEDGGSRSAGISSLALRAVKSTRVRLQETESPASIAEGLYVTGVIQRTTDFETMSQGFYLDEAYTTPDPLLDDHALFFRSANGIIVILGCAHSGVVNTLRHIESSMPGERIRAVIGGMHLRSASQERIRRTIEELEKREIDILVPSHCTGEHAAFQFRQAFGTRSEPCSVGREFVFSLPDELS
jgi:7,8-dihydropterin-6-yl-methyl-4-(beta-D-ribofuranosyl)aminobenzene 5'-phosphate synthase